MNLPWERLTDLIKSLTGFMTPQIKQITSQIRGVPFSTQHIQPGIGKKRTGSNLKGISVFREGEGEFGLAN